MALLLPLVAALAAILILPGGSFYFDVVPKAAVILGGVGLVFVMRRRWPLAMLRTPFAGIVALQIAIAIATSFTSTHPQLSFFGSVWRRSGTLAEIAVLILAVATAAQLAWDRSAVRVFLRITVLTSIPIAIYGILQYFGIDPLLAAAGYHFGEGQFMIVRPPATLGHAAYFATYLLYAAFAGAALLADKEKQPWKIAAIAASILAMFAIVLSGTRAALLGFVAGAVFVIVRQSGTKINWRFAASAAVVLAMIGAFYLSPAGERLRARAFWASEDRMGGSRLLLWRDSLRMSTTHPFKGFGPETFAVEFPQHQSVELARQFPDFYHESAHNIFLDVLTAKGIFGLAALLALVILCLGVARGPIGGAFVAMLVAQQFTTFTLPTELYFYLCAALLVSNIEIERVVPARRQWWPAVFAIPFLAMAIYLATGDALLASARRALDDNNPDRAWQLQDRARTWHMTADVYFSRRYFQLAGPDAARARAWQFAMASAVRAPQTAEDRQNALVNLAALESPSGDAAAVELTLRQAVAAAPRWYKSHWLLAQVLSLEGRGSDARKESETAVDLDAGKHAEVQATRDRLK